MYLTNLFYFVKDVLDHDKKIKILNRGDKIMFKVSDRNEEEQEKEESRFEYRKDKRYSTKNKKRDKAPVVEEVSREPEIEETKGFKKRKLDRSTVVLDRSGVLPTDEMTRDEQVTEFLRRMEQEKQKRDYEAKVKKLSK